MHKFFVGALLLSLAGCNCGTKPVVKNYGKIEVDKTNLDFGKSCPQPTDPQYQVAYPTRVLTVSNTGQVLSNLNIFSIDAASADIFTWDASTVPATIAAGNSAQITITFKPKTTGGTVTATLHVQGDRPADAEPDKYDITLLGEALGFDPVPKFSMACTGDLRFPTIDGCAVTTTTPHMDFSDTPANGLGEILISVKNGGCPTLSIDSMAVTTTAGKDGTFGLAVGQGTALNVLGGNAAPGTIKVQFKPTEVDDSLAGELTFNTNDPVNKTVKVILKGAGTAPLLRIETAVGCGAPAPTQNPNCCDFASKVACTGKFNLINSGNEDLTITKISLKNGNALFTLADTSAVGQTVPKVGSLPNAITVNYVPGATKGSDILVVESTGGTAQAELRGGSPPFLDTTPVSIVDFGLGLNHSDHYAPLTLTNKDTYNKQLDLTLHSLVVTDARQTFDVVTTATLACNAQGATPFTADTAVHPGDSFVACVHFKSDAIGGVFSANLNVHSDDPNFPEPDGRLLELKAQADCATRPFPEIEIHAADNVGGVCPCTDACPVTSSCSDHFPKLPATEGTLVLTGITSYAAQYDFVVDQCVENVAGRQPVAEYEWILKSPPNPASASINPAGRGTSPTTTLTFKEQGVHQVQLKVYDAQGNASNATVTLTVNVLAPL